MKNTHIFDLPEASGNSLLSCRLALDLVNHDGPVSSPFQMNEHGEQGSIFLTDTHNPFQDTVDRLNLVDADRQRLSWIQIVPLRGEVARNRERGINSLADALEFLLANEPDVSQAKGIVVDALTPGRCPVDVDWERFLELVGNRPCLAIGPATANFNCEWQHKFSRSDGGLNEFRISSTSADGLASEFTAKLSYPHWEFAQATTSCL
ncbi:hypothetical protein AB1L42_21865 [Thalassoglobus sp. JC818]|uniref:hypothetical protein n=1 Tax=Thalassoglobus sp. JC818 TaxID=3232136 RepID=UPI0034577127